MLLVVLWEVQNSAVVDRMPNFTTNDAELHFGIISSEITTEFGTVALHVSSSSTICAVDWSFQNATVEPVTTSATDPTVQCCRG